uniref:Uncharacterized protein n=1 Tax=Nelumbo nucifera TaxID=4432 RepID=A0A822YNP0_NELNU|nr:TPA_asm: hypothetical protein HUJ06_004850 [Nelumbo nucifera]
MIVVEGKTGKSISENIMITSVFAFFFHSYLYRLGFPGGMKAVYNDPTETLLWCRRFKL